MTTTTTTTTKKPQPLSRNQERNRVASLIATMQDLVASVTKSHQGVLSETEMVLGRVRNSAMARQDKGTAQLYTHLIEAVTRYRMGVDWERLTTDGADTDGVIEQAGEELDKRMKAIKEQRTRW